MAKPYRVVYSAGGGEDSSLGAPGVAGVYGYSLKY